MLNADLFGNNLPVSNIDGWPADYEEQFWRECPRKVAKLAALKALAKIREKRMATFQEIMIGVRRWSVMAARTDPKFIKHPATWLNSGGWMDEYLPGESNGQRSASQRAFELARQAHLRNGD